MSPGSESDLVLTNTFKSFVEFLIPSNKTLTDVDVFSKTTFLVI